MAVSFFFEKSSRVSVYHSTAGLNVGSTIANLVFWKLLYPNFDDFHELIQGLDSSLAMPSLAVALPTSTQTKLSMTEIIN